MTLKLRNTNFEVDEAGNLIVRLPNGRTIAPVELARLAEEFQFEGGMEGHVLIAVPHSRLPDDFPETKNAGAVFKAEHCALGSHALPDLWWAIHKAGDAMRRAYTDAYAQRQGPDYFAKYRRRQALNDAWKAKDFGQLNALLGTKVASFEEINEAMAAGGDLVGRKPRSAGKASRGEKSWWVELTYRWTDPSGSGWSVEWTSQEDFREQDAD